MRPKLWLASAALAFLVAPVAAAEEPEAVFQREYGQKYEECKKNPDPAAAVAFARKLVADAKQFRSLAAILYEKAYDLGSLHSDGYGIAIEAMERSVEVAPARSPDARENIAAIRKRQYDAVRGIDRERAGEALIEAYLECQKAHAGTGDYAKAIAACKRASAVATSIRSSRKKEIEAIAARTQARQTAEKRIEELRSHLRDAPQDSAVRNELVRLLTVEADNPVTARNYVDESCAEDLRKHVPELAKGMDEIAESACLDTAGWCEVQAEKASVSGKTIMLGRALALYERFLNLHDAQDADRDRASIACNRIRETLDALAGPADDTSRWPDLLSGLDISRGGLGEGRWWRKGSNVVVKAHNLAWLPLPVMPRGSYEFEVEFTPDSDCEMNVLLPAGAGAVALVLQGWDGRTSGLEWIGGQYSNRNESTVKSSPLEPERPHRIRIRVLLKAKDAEVSVRVDGKLLISWSGAQSALSLSSTWALQDSRRLGIGTRASTVTFHHARLNMLSGKPISKKPAQ
jgi:hypothetical protein